MKLTTRGKQEQLTEFQTVFKNYSKTMVTMQAGRKSTSAKTNYFGLDTRYQRREYGRTQKRNRSDKKTPTVENTEGTKLFSGSHPVFLKPHKTTVRTNNWAEKLLKKSTGKFYNEKLQ